MPRVVENTDSLLSDLTTRLERLVTVARKEGRESALAAVRSLVTGGNLGAATARPGRGRPPWDGPAPAKRPAARAKKARARRRNPWAHMTPEQRAERVRKMLAGRGLKPRGER